MHTFVGENSMRPEEFVENWTQIAGKDGSAMGLALERHGLHPERCAISKGSLEISCANEALAV
jgi:hypothetical protein